MKHKRVVLSLAIVVMMFASLTGSPVMAYGNSDSGALGDLSIEVSNYISQNRKTASAQTWTSNPSSSTSVSATLYWEDYDNLSFGSFYETRGNYGSSSVGRSFFSDDDAGKCFYQVVSNHYVSYNEATYSRPNLTTVTY
jgi:hypothetical protein